MGWTEEDEQQLQENQVHVAARRLTTDIWTFELLRLRRIKEG